MKIDPVIVSVRSNTLFRIIGLLASAYEVRFVGFFIVKFYIKTNLAIFKTKILNTQTLLHKNTNWFGKTYT